MGEAFVMPKGRLLGVDYGQVRIGLAICDSEQIIASPLSVYRRRDAGADAEFFRQLVVQEDVSGLVVGLPLHMSGDESGKAREARAFGEWLSQVTSLPVDYWDERFTTLEADEYLRGAGMSSAKRRQRVDKVAAQIMLQAYLEAHRPTLR
jgi:putative Holliday junction resolvase